MLIEITTAMNETVTVDEFKFRRTATDRRITRRRDDRDWRRTADLYLSGHMED